MRKLFALLMGLMISTAAIAEPTGDFQTISIEDGLSKNEKKVRDAAVKITDGYGHGSGSIIKYHDLQLVLTAQHVASGHIGTQYLVINGNTVATGVLIYADPLHDIAVLWLPEGNDLEGRGLKYNPQDQLINIGGAITYSGHPSWHSLMTYRGYVAGVETLAGAGPQLMLNTYGWFGCSGSVIYNTSGQIVGILWGVDIERPDGLQIQENMIWVSPIQNLDMRLAVKELCIALEDKPKACRK